MDLSDLEIDRGSLKSSSVHGVAITFGAQGVRFALNFAFQIWLAHLIGPSDFGLVAMATPILVFVGVFGDLGLTQATVQRPGITQAQVSFTFWVNLALGAGLALLLAAASPLIAGFYREPRVGPVVIVLALGLLLGGAYGQHLALLTRRMAFGRLAVIDLVSACVSYAAAIAAALHGAGYWSILVYQVGGSATAMILAYALAPWRPSRPAVASDWRALISFGRDLTLANLADMISSNLDNVLIGRYLGARPLGFYDRAYKLLLLPVSQIAAPLSRVALPLLSRTHAETAAYRQGFARLLDVAAFLMLPPVLVAVVQAPALIPWLLGPQWTGVAAVFSLLGASALAMPYGLAGIWLMVSQGRSRELRDFAFLRTALMVVAFFIGVRFGVLGVSAGVVILSLVLAPVLLALAARKGPVDLGVIAGVAAPHLIGAGLVALAEVAIANLGAGALVRIFGGAAIAYPVFLLGLASVHSGRLALRDLVGEALRMVRTLAARLPGRAPSPKTAQGAREGAHLRGSCGG